MVATAHSTPLMSIEGVVIDTETTSLDAREARLVQIGAVRFLGGHLAQAQHFSRLVNPGVAIPAASTAIHGLKDGDVAGAPPFAAVADELATFLGPAILIGHNIAYDLAVLRAEHERAGKPWQQPRALDIGMLSRLALPTLAKYGLKQLCEFLKVGDTTRGSATDDAITTAHVFEALVPLLREKGIRTLAEAEAASRQLAEVQVGEAMGAAPLPAGTAAQTRPLARLDSYAYRHRVRDVMSAPPIMADASMTVGEAVGELLHRKVSSLLVRLPGGQIGIVTERDVLRAIDKGRTSADAGGGASLPLSAIANAPLVSVSAEAFLYRAIGRMDRLGIRHLGVRDPATGQIVGAVTTRNLLRHRAATAIMLGDEIDSADTSAELGRAWAKLAPMARQLLEEEVDPRAISQVVSSEIGILTRRAAQIATLDLERDGWGPAPVAFSVLVLGSAGRGESLLAADQDNAIVYASGPEGGPEDRWFEAMATRMCAILDEVGVPLCKGGIMAKNRKWRMSLADWRTTIDGWVRRQRPEDLLNVDIFFDGIPVHGDESLGRQIWEHAYAVGSRTPDFVKLLTENTRKKGNPFTLFGGFRLDDSGRTDLKMHGLMPIFSAARVLSIRHDVRARPTPDRLRGVAAKGIGSPAEIEDVIDAHRVILGAMLGQQLADLEAGVPLSPRVDPGRLDKDGQAELKKALGKVDAAIGLVSEGRL